MGQLEWDELIRWSISERSSVLSEPMDIFWTISLTDRNFNGAEVAGSKVWLLVDFERGCVIYRFFNMVWLMGLRESAVV